ncbi:MAG: hypothetical protein JXB29_07835 [Sedimentisphaerales bacterium]|nr:hypothetical protein [Sedimentisphaerales bacterium]
MEAQNFLGIHLSRDKATVVYLGIQGRERKVLDCFSVTVEEKDGQESPAATNLAELVAKTCAARKLKFSDITIALDCTLFSQHSVHTEFSNPKRIAATVRFDAEEVLAADISELAVAFRVISSDQNGSDLTVFTAQKKLLSDFLSALQAFNMDPVIIEPDVNSLARFAWHNASLGEGSQHFFCALSLRRAYFVIPKVSNKGRPEQFSEASALMRTFLIAPQQQTDELLAVEIPITLALLNDSASLDSIELLDADSPIDCQQLSSKLDMAVSKLDLAQSVEVTSENLAQCSSPVDFAIGYGAALASLERSETANFRNDFNPYQGKKLRIQKALKFLSVSVTVLLLAFGLYVQLQLFQKTKPLNRLRAKFAEDYSPVMLGEKPPTKIKDAVEKLRKQLRRIRAVKSGLLSISGEESVSAKMTLVLQAFNECAQQVDLNVNLITITQRAIRITGDTSNRKNTLKLFDSIKSNKLDIGQQRLDEKAGRDNFSITVVPK